MDDLVTESLVIHVAKMVARFNERTDPQLKNQGIVNRPYCFDPDMHNFFDRIIRRHKGRRLTMRQSIRVISEQSRQIAW
jgi:hypothetical protein